MPNASRKTITLRVSQDQHVAWTRAAKADDRSLSKWIARLCDAATSSSTPAGKSRR